jgi:polar amino acid transport system substrate-binding protein
MRSAAFRCKTLAVLAVTVLTACTMLAACSSSSSTSPGATGASGASGGSGASGSTGQGVSFDVPGVGVVHEDAALASQLPASYKSGIIVATSAPGAPFEEIVNGTLEGMDIDLSNAVAATLGTKAIIENVNYAGEIPGIEAGKYDMIASGIGDIAGRGKVLNFIMYDTSPGSVLIILSANPDHIANWLDMCGKVLAVQTGSHDIALATGLSKSLCAAHGKPAIQQLTLPTESDQVIAVASGKAAAMSETVFEAASLPAGQYKVIFDPQERALAAQLGFGAIRQGIGVSVTEPALSKLVYQAALELSKEGFWAKIIDKWGVGPYIVNPPLYNEPA